MYALLLTLYLVTLRISYLKQLASSVGLSDLLKVGFSSAGMARSIVSVRTIVYGLITVQVPT